ncbi:MAG TPA: hypothetical protein VFN87_00155 [Solirubrobacteraceae bacterium]|nr:hypothetical protein [Solirubrobacteraceae bacterium]
MAIVPTLSRDLIPQWRPGVTSAKTAQDAALAALLGGNLFGRMAMHPALTAVSDKEERGQVLNRAWQRYGTVNSAALAALVAGWLSTRDAVSAGRQSRHRRRLILAKDVAVGTVVVTGLASALGGLGFARQAPGGAVPMESGSETAEETPRRAAALKQAVNVLGDLNLAAEVALLVVDAQLDGRATH